MSPVTYDIDADVEWTDIDPSDWRDYVDPDEDLDDDDQADPPSPAHVRMVLGFDPDELFDEDFDDADDDPDGTPTDNAGDFFAECERDEHGWCTSGGGASAKLGDLIKRSNDPDAVTESEIETAVASVHKMPKEQVFKLITEAGVEGARSYDSKSSMTQRLKNRLMATKRSRERSQA